MTLAMNATGRAFAVRMLAFPSRGGAFAVRVLASQSRGLALHAKVFAFTATWLAFADRSLSANDRTFAANDRTLATNRRTLATNGVALAANHRGVAAPEGLPAPDDGPPPWNDPRLGANDEVAVASDGALAVMDDALTGENHPLGGAYRAVAIVDGSAGADDATPDPFVTRGSSAYLGETPAKQALSTLPPMARLVLSLTLVWALFGCNKASDTTPPAGSASAAAGSASAATAASASAPAAPAKAPLRVAYSDWPGWTAFEVGIQKGWFKEAGVNVEFSWFDYLPSLDAFSSGKVDAVMATNGDALVTGANGGKSKMILLTDYSNGNDKVIGRPGIAAFKNLKGKKVGLELTLVEHLLFLKACEKNGLKPSDVQLVNFPTNETPNALSSGQVAAVAAWYPVSGQALKAVAGSKPLFTSADVPGLIYDSVAVNPTSLAQRHDDWVKFVKVWYKISDFVRDPKTQAEAVAIMAAKVGVKADEYAAAMPGTYFLSLDESKKRYVKAPGLDSLYGSTSIANDFNVTNKVYKETQPVDDYIDPTIVSSL
jgi:NitT/TauT family transport system substrate-binding protein